MIATTTTISPVANVVAGAAGVGGVLATAMIMTIKVLTITERLRLVQIAILVTSNRAINPVNQTTIHQTVDLAAAVVEAVEAGAAGVGAIAIRTTIRATSRTSRKTIRPKATKVVAQALKAKTPTQGVFCCEIAK